MVTSQARQRENQLKCNPSFSVGSAFGQARKHKVPLWSQPSSLPSSHHQSRNLFSNPCYCCYMLRPDPSCMPFPQPQRRRPRCATVHAQEFSVALLEGTTAGLAGKHCWGWGRACRPDVGGFALNNPAACCFSRPCADGHVACYLDLA